MKGTTRRLLGALPPHTLCALSDRTGGGRAQRRPEEKRARLLAAARAAFAESGYGASVHEICQAAGVGIGTFYHQFPDKSDLMRFLMDEEHQYRVRAFDTLAAKSAEEFSAQLTRVLAGSDPALLRAMIEACGIDERLRDFGREVRKETRERLATALARAREERNIRHPALDAGTAAWATLEMGDTTTDSAATAAFQKAVAVIVFAEADATGRARG
jgi:AcrR family transcriptional regulator